MYSLSQCKETTEELQENLKKLRDLADGLENMHWHTTVGSLTGGVIGAAGGITSIVGLSLAPVTLGVSLIVTGVGIGVGVAGGVTAGALNIRNMVKKSGGRQAVRCVIKEFEEKVRAVVTWLQDIGKGCETLVEKIESTKSKNTGIEIGKENLSKVGSAGIVIGLGGISEAARLAKVVSIGRVAAHTARVVKVAATVTTVFSALFVAVDVFFIAMDAREIHRIKEAIRLSDQNIENVKSETMKFVMSIRQNAEVLQEVVDELSQVTTQLCDENLQLCFNIEEDLYS